jgi:hypothetical protein
MICSVCGTRLPDDSDFCAICGTPLSEDARSRQQAPKTYKLTISRENQFFVVNPAIEVKINGISAQPIENGGSYTLDLPEGRYRIEFAASIRKTSVDFEIHCDSILNLKWNRVTGGLNAKVYAASGAH